MKILIFTASTGGGHKRTASALQDHLKSVIPDVEVKIVDAIKEVNKLVDKMVCGGYELMATKAPKLYGAIYGSTQKEGFDITNPLSAMFCLRMFPAINEFDPDVIISTHPFAAEMVSHLKTLKKIDKPIISILTDYGPHRSYLTKHVNAYVVPAPECVDPLAKLGINRKIIYPYGIPVQDVFCPAGEEEVPQIKAELGLDPDPYLPTVLMMAGSFGVSDITEIYNELMDLPEQFQLVIITGRNKKLFRVFEDLTRKAPKKVQLIYFTNTVQKYMQCSDVIVTKPGGLTISEAIACNLPMILFESFPGQEKDNADFLTGRGMAVEISKNRSAAQILQELLRSPDQLRRMKEACESLDTSKCREHLTNLVKSLAASYQDRRQRNMVYLEEAYLDNSATTRVCAPALEKIVETTLTEFGNPSSIHDMGFRAEKIVTKAREDLADVIGAQPKEIVFTSCGTEANNMAVLGAARSRRKMGNRIVTTAIEHPSVARCMDVLEEEGFEIIRLQPDEKGCIRDRDVLDAVDENTILVSMMMVNNEVGSILPIDAAAKAIARKQAPALLHVDAVQALGRLPIRVKRMRIDLLSVSSHKIHGPKGAGALYIRDGVHIPPLLLGGGQEKGMRSGTEAVPAIAGFGAAAAAIPNTVNSQPKVQKLCDHLRKRLTAIPGVEIHSPKNGCPYILNFSTMSIRSETMIHYLSEKQIFVSGGSACSGGRESPVLKAMQLSREAVLSSIRVSFTWESTMDEVDRLADALEEGTKVLAGNLKNRT